jgi:hypothetical protein
MGRVIHPWPAAWEPRENELRAQNALWEEQERLTVALALESDPVRQQGILEELDGTDQEVADHNWQADWERRSYAIPDAPFRIPEVPEHLRFPELPCGEVAEIEENDEQFELELELH